MVSHAKFFFLTLLTMVFLMMVAQCSAPTPAAPPVKNQAGAPTVNSKSKPDEPEGEAEIPKLKPVNLAAGQKLKALATTSIVGDIVKNIGGNQVELTILLPLNADPHTFEPTPADLIKVTEAQVVFANGMGLEGFLTKMIENAGQSAMVEVSHGVPVRQMSEAEHAAEEAEHEAEPHHDEGDPHTWTTPANAIIFAHNIAEALTALDPANSATYQANAKDYTAKLNEMDGWIKAQIATIPAENREMVADHLLFGYYADRYGLQQIGAVIPAFSTGAAPSANELAALENIVRQHHAKAIFVGSAVNPTLAQRVADDTGLKLVRLYTHSLGEAGSDVENYLDYLRHNTTAIVNALK
jgi:manganese/iron transport system substrate-binding protein